MSFAILQIREEHGGDAYKLVGYQQLELIAEELQHTHTSQLAVSAVLKKTLGAFLLRLRLHLSLLLLLLKVFPVICD